LRILRLSVVALILTGCIAYVGPPRIAVPEGRAVEIAHEFARSRGLNPTGTKYVAYEGRRGFWKVSLWLGPTSCGVMRVNVDGYNGSVFDFRPYLRPCGGPPPVIEEDRADY